MADKLTESITVKVSPELLRVVRLRAEQRGFVSAGEYMRSLLDSDLAAARADYHALAAIFSNGGTAVQGNREILGNLGGGHD